MNSKKIGNIEFQPLGKRIEVPAGTTLLEAARRAGVPLASECGGRGKCGRCRVEILSGNVSQPDSDEKSALKRKGASPKERLACRVRVDGDAGIHVPSASRKYDSVVQVHGRLRSYGGVPVGLPPEKTAPLGVAIDMGTTTIAGRLLDLESGEEVCSAGRMNPQISVGEDIISRMDYAIHDSSGARKLPTMLLIALNDLVKNLCNKGNASFDQVLEMVICGNTVISHLLLQLPVAPLARAPYIAGFSSPLEISAEDLGLNNVPRARILIMPCIEGFVGGDHVAMILGCGLDRSPDTVLGVDIGTNTEIVLAKPGSMGGLFVASCASGPALEGAHIRDGMRAASGAIERVRITESGPVVKTINREPPIGLCGSGILDALSELLRLGFVDDRGHLKKSGDRIRSGPDGPSYRLVSAESSGSGRDILLTQRDISEIQLAKGAIHAAMETLLEKTGTPPEAIARVYLAGAFGDHLNIDGALAIGLFPKLPKAHFVQAGNAALVGVSLVLMSNDERERAAAIALSARHMELANDSRFSRLFVRAMRFKTQDSK